jgi:HEAT repeat protein
MKSRPVVLTLALLTAVGALFVGLWAASRPAAVAPASANQIAVVTMLPALPIDGPQAAVLAAGEVTTYHFSVGSTLGPSEADAAEERLARVAFTGQLTTRVLSTPGPDALVRYEIKDPRLDIEARGAVVEAGAQAEIVRGLALPFVVATGPRGEAKRIHLAPDLESTSMKLLHELVAALQFVAPSDNKASWTVMQPSALGPVQAFYQRQAKANVFTRRRQVVGEQARTVSFEESHEVAELNEGRMIRLTSRTVERHGIAGQASLRVETLVSIDRQSFAKEAIPAGAALIPGPGSELGKFPVVLAAGARIPARPQRAFAAVMTELRSAGVRGLGERRDGLRREVETHLLSDPQLTSAVAAVARGTDAAAELARSALRDAGTPAAQTELAQLATDASLSRASRQDAITGLGLVEEPTAATAAALDTLMMSEQDPELREQASYAAGSTAGRLRTQDAQGSERVVEHLIAALAAAETPEAKIAALEAIGNSGAASAFTPVMGALTAGPASVSAAAARALRLMPERRVEEVLGRLIAAGDPEVRGAALFAAGFRPLEAFLPAIDALLRREPDAKLRRAAVACLSGKLGVDAAPAVLTLLERVAQSDPEKEIRAQATQALAEQREEELRAANDGPGDNG